MQLDFYLVGGCCTTTIEVANGDSILSYALALYYTSSNNEEDRIFNIDANPLNIWYSTVIDKFYSECTKLATHNLVTQYSFDYASHYYLKVVDYKKVYLEHFI